MAVSAMDLSRHNKMSVAGREAFYEKERHVRRNSLDGRIILSICAVIFLAAAGGGVWVLLRGGAAVPAPADLTGAGSAADAPAAGDALGQMRQRGRECLAAFFSAASTEEKSQWVLDAERVLPAMREYYAKGGVDSSGGAAAFANMRADKPDDPSTGAMIMRHPAGCLDGSPLFLYFKDDGTRARFDWEGYEQELNGRLVAFLTPRPTGGGVYRVGLSRAHLFEPGQTDSQGAEIWLPGGRKMDVRAVAAPGSAPAQALSELQWNYRQRAVARLEWEADSSGKPVLHLREILHWDFAD